MFEFNDKNMKITNTCDNWTLGHGDDEMAVRRRRRSQPSIVLGQDAVAGPLLLVELPGRHGRCLTDDMTPNLLLLWPPGRLAAGADVALVRLLGLGIPDPQSCSIGDRHHVPAPGVIFLVRTFLGSGVEVVVS